MRRRRSAEKDEKGTLPSLPADTDVSGVCTTGERGRERILTCVSVFERNPIRTHPK